MHDPTGIPEKKNNEMQEKHEIRENSATHS